MTKVGLAVHRTFHSFHSRNFRLFFAGQFVSVTGTWMQSVATAWLVLQLTHSGTALGVVTGLTFTPALLIGAWGGLVADRFDKRKVLIVTQSAAAVLALGLWIPVAFGTVSLSFVYVIALLNGIVTALDTPTRQSFYAEMVGSKDIPNAVSLNSAVMTGTRIVGPAIAGVIIATHGVGPVFLVNAISYIAVIGGLIAMRPRELHRTGAVERGRGQLREGLRYVMDRPALRDTLALMGVIFLFSFNFAVLLPLMAERTFGGGAHTLGWLFSSMGVGSLAGALLAAAKPRHSFRKLAVFGVLTGIAITASAVAPTRDWALLTLALVGFTSITFMISGNSALQLSSSAQMRGRVMALYAVVFLGSTPFGATLSGWVGQHFGPRLAMAGAGVIAVGASAVALILLRRMQTREARVAPQTEVTGVPQPVSA
jgi:MFS family permease